MIDVKKLAERAGFRRHAITKSIITMHSSGAWVDIEDTLTRFAALVRQEALEEAIQLLDEFIMLALDDRLRSALIAAKAAIRAMKEKA